MLKAVNKTQGPTSGLHSGGGNSLTSRQVGVSCGQVLRAGEQ